MLHTKLQDLMETRPPKGSNLSDEYIVFAASLIGKKAKLSVDYFDPTHYSHIENEAGQIVDHPKKGLPREVLHPKGTVMVIDRVARDHSLMLLTGELRDDGAAHNIWLPAAQVELVE